MCIRRNHFLRFSAVVLVLAVVASACGRIGAVNDGAPGIDDRVPSAEFRCFSGV